jgi:hypothetical protein
MTAIDQPHERTPVNDGAALSFNQANANANFAWHNELHTSTSMAPAEQTQGTGLHTAGQLHEAWGSVIGARADTTAMAKGETQPGNEVSDKNKHASEATTTALQALGLTDISKQSQKAESAMVSQQIRFDAFESVYSKATGNPDNHAGMNRTNDGNTLQFNNNPALSMQGRQLAIA